MPLQDDEVRRLGLHEQASANDPAVVEEVVAGMQRMLVEKRETLQASLLLPLLGRTDLPPSVKLSRFVALSSPDEKVARDLLRLWSVWGECALYDDNGERRPVGECAEIMEAAAIRLLSWLRTVLHPVPELWVVVANDSSAAR